MKTIMKAKLYYLKNGSVQIQGTAKTGYRFVYVFGELNKEARDVWQSLIDGDYDMDMDGGNVLKEWMDSEPNPGYDPAGYGRWEKNNPWIDYDLKNVTNGNYVTMDYPDPIPGEWE